MNKLITPPAVLAVSLADAKLDLRIDGDDLDNSITRWIKGITMAAEHETGRAFVHQDWSVTLDKFPDAIRLDRAPVAEVLSLKFYDADNVLQTLHPDDMYLDKITEPGYLVPAAGKAWPATYSRPNALVVTYRAGYGPTDATVPECAKQYILANLCLQFDPASGAATVGKPFTVSFLDRLLDSLRVYG